MSPFNLSSSSSYFHLDCIKCCKMNHVASDGEQFCNFCQCPLLNHQRKDGDKISLAKVFTTSTATGNTTTTNSIIANDESNDESFIHVWSTFKYFQFNPSLICLGNFAIMPGFKDESLEVTLYRQVLKFTFNGLAWCIPYTCIRKRIKIQVHEQDVYMYFKLCLSSSESCSMWTRIQTYLFEIGGPFFHFDPRKSDPTFKFIIFKWDSEQTESWIQALAHEETDNFCLQTSYPLTRDMPSLTEHIIQLNQQLHFVMPFMYC